MKLETLWNDSERAVSPVIGVILMVAITVILAAVIGSMVMGLADDVGDTTPTMQISANPGPDASTLATGAGYDEGEAIVLEHGGGDSVNSNEYKIQLRQEGSSSYTEISPTQNLTVDANGDTVYMNLSAQPDYGVGDSLVILVHDEDSTGSYSLNGPTVDFSGVYELQIFHTQTEQVIYEDSIEL